jgi:hypothetical protein
MSVLSNAVSFCTSHAHRGLRTHPCRDHQVLSEACVRSAETVRRPHLPRWPLLRPLPPRPCGMSAGSRLHSRQGRLGDAQPVSFYSDETGVAIVAECCMPQVMPTSRSGFAERLTRQRIEANPSRTAGAATIDGRADTVACTRLGFATVPRLAIPQRGKAWRDWARRSAMALTAGRCRGNRLA